MRKLIFSIIACVMLLLIPIITSYADTFLSPEPFNIYSQDGTMVFRWTPDYPIFREAVAAMYKNGELLFTMEGLPATGVNVNNFFFSQDFRHMAFLPTIGMDIAIQFYTMGELVKTHYIFDLVKDTSLLSQSVTMLFWRGRFLEEGTNAVELMAERDVLRVITVDRITYEFDMTTGEILSYVQGDTNFPGRERIIYNLLPREIYVPQRDDITITIDGQPVAFADQQPIIVDGKTLVPIRGVFETLGWDVDWCYETSSALLIKGFGFERSVLVTIRIGELYFTSTATVYHSASDSETLTPLIPIQGTGIIFPLEVPAQIIGGRTMLPLREILESAGYFLDWDKTTRTVLISTARPTHHR